MEALDIQILDYGLGNSNSIASCLRQLGCYASVTSDPNQLEKAKVIIIPGVGSFQQGMKNLKEGNTYQILNELHERNETYFIGICLGMQLFAKSSVEGGATEGFGWLPGAVKSLSEKVKSRPLPHIGWNAIQVEDEEESITKGLNGEHFYFDHEYYMDVNDEYIQAYCDYESQIPSIVQQGKVYGFQFHPEKSQIAGKKLLIQTLNKMGVDRKSVWIESV